MSHLGVDIGTTGCKAAAFDADGTVLASSYREYPLLSSEDGRAELEPNRVIADCIGVIRDVARRCVRDPVRALAISSQGEAFTPLDRSGAPLCNAMVSSDRRACGQVRAWPEAFGRQRLYAITGHSPHPMFTVFKLLWLKENRPDVWAASRQFCCFEELLQLRLGVQPAISWPLAGRTLLFDVVRHEWSAEILADLGLDGGQLARPAPSGSIVGEIPKSNAAEFGLPAGVLVVAGGHDQPCAALGVGALRTGQAMYATGTVECICPALAQARFTPDLQANNLCTYDYTIPGFYTTVAFSLTGGNILKWFRDEFGQPEVSQAQATQANAYELLLKVASEVPTRLLVLPHFTPTGTPYFDPDATGAVFGLTMNTSRGEVLRALLEGVAFEMRLNLDILAASGIEVRELTATGGGSRSRFWTQLKADVLGKPIRSSPVADAGCLGAAILARAAESTTSLADVVVQMVRPGTLIEPNSRHARYYADRFELYRHLYPAVKALGLVT